jgi:hypothetical protein
MQQLILAIGNTINRVIEPYTVLISKTILKTIFFIQIIENRKKKNVFNQMVSLKLNWVYTY